MDVYDLKPDFPNYRDVKIGDIFVWFVGLEHKYNEKGQREIHGHWFEVLEKGARYAEITARYLKCDNFTGANCTRLHRSKILNIGWNALLTNQHKTRWLRTPGARVLFSRKPTDETK